MTTSTTTNRWEYSGNGVTTSFSVGAVFDGETDLEVWLQVTATGVEELQIISTDYSVTGGSEATGSVVFGTAPATGERVVIIRKEPLTADVSDTIERFSAAGFEIAFDRIARQTQRIYDMASRSIMLRSSDLLSGVAGLFDAGSRRIINVADPVNDQDAVSLAYVEANFSAGEDGAPGTNGSDGNDGWTPVLAIASDGARRVHQIIGYTGGEGVAPTTYLNYYIGALGPVVAVGDGVDIRGAAGAAGAGTGDMQAVTYDPTTVGGDAFAMDNMAEGADTKIMTGAERTKLSGISTSADVTVAAIIAAAAKATPVDADTMALIDSEAASVLKEVTWANVKATLKTYFDTLYLTLTGAAQVISGGFRVTVYSIGTVASGTTTLDPGNRPLQKMTNGGASTLAPGSNKGMIILTILNNASAGALSTVGWTKVSGDAFTTTNGHIFTCHCVVDDNGSHLIVQARQ